jgi:hypothetical protein
MRTFYFTFAIWRDSHWRAAFRRAWRKRRYWLALPATPHIEGRAMSLQLGPLTFRFTAQGVHHNG